MNKNYTVSKTVKSALLMFCAAASIGAQAQTSDTTDKIDEVVVVGYGTAKKKEFTGANSAIKG